MFERKSPIRSTQEDVRELAEDIDRFVIGLAERIDTIQDAELAGHHGELANHARSLSQEAERVGYPVLAQIAKAAMLAAIDGKTEGVRESVTELTELAQRVRLGHRGAA
jgi:HPt (histidine-containing phosphotransfer) domain-containing protein